MIRAILLDSDGVQVDTERLYFEAHVLAMEKLAVNPEHCLAVEDSPRGAAGVACGISHAVDGHGLMPF